MARLAVWAGANIDPTNPLIDLSSLTFTDKDLGDALLFYLKELDNALWQDDRDKKLQQIRKDQADKDGRERAAAAEKHEKKLATDLCETREIFAQQNMELEKKKEGFKRALADEQSKTAKAKQEADNENKKIEQANELAQKEAKGDRGGRFGRQESETRI